MSFFQEVRALAELHGIPVVPDLDQLATDLKGPLSQYRELELRLDGRRMDLVTLHDDPYQLAAFFRVLERRGLTVGESPAPSLALLGVGMTLGMKLPLAGDPQSGEIYIRGALPVSEAHYFLTRQGCDPYAIERIRQIGLRLDKTHLHMLAADVALEPVFSCYFTTYLRPDEKEDGRIAEALALAGMPLEAIEKALQLHSLMGAARPATLFVSLRLRRGVLEPLVKLDYSAVRMGSLMQVMADHQLHERIALAMAWGQILKTYHADYVGLVFEPRGLRDLRAYFTRPCSEEIS